VQGAEDARTVHSDRLGGVGLVALEQGLFYIENISLSRQWHDSHYRVQVTDIAFYLLANAGFYLVGDNPCLEHVVCRGWVLGRIIMCVFYKQAGVEERRFAHRGCVDKDQARAQGSGSKPRPMKWGSCDIIFSSPTYDMF